jgi:hypothetical protein
VKEVHTKTSASAKRFWFFVAVIIGIAGIAIYFSTYFPPLQACKLWVKFGRELGIAMVISVIIALVLDRLVHESLLDAVIEAVNILKGGSDILKGASELGIEDIFARRVEKSRERADVRMKNAIEEQLSRKSGEILIACVASPEFFRQGTGIGSMFWEYLPDSSNECNLKVLLLCPESKWAEIRAKLEPGHPTIEDIRASAMFLHNLKEKCKDKVQFKCYDFPPIAYLIITEKFLFLEGYPLMRLEKGEGPLGGKTPMLVVRNDTEAYKRWKGHFYYIWEEHSQNYEQHHQA